MAEHEQGQQHGEATFSFKDLEHQLARGPEAISLESAMPQSEAVALSKQLMYRLPELLEARVAAGPVRFADREGRQLTIDRDTYQQVFSQTNLDGYDSLYFGSSTSNMGPELLIEATQAGTNNTRAIKVSMADHDGVPVSVTTDAQSSREESHPLTYGDGLFVQDALAALTRIK